MRKVIFFMLIVFACVSCKYVSQRYTKSLDDVNNTSVLAERTCELLDFFMEAKIESGYCSDNEQLVISGVENRGGKYFCLIISAYDTTILKPYGSCKGVACYKGKKIMLFGDSWNDYFWESDTMYTIPDFNTKDELIFYDPFEWILVIRTQDTTVNSTLDDIRYPISDLSQISSIMSKTQIPLDTIDSILKL